MDSSIIENEFKRTKKCPVTRDWRYHCFVTCVT